MDTGQTFITFTNSQLRRKGRIIYCLLMHKTHKVETLDKRMLKVLFCRKDDDVRH